MSYPTGDIYDYENRLHQFGNNLLDFAGLNQEQELFSGVESETQREKWDRELLKKRQQLSLTAADIFSGAYFALRLQSWSFNTGDEASYNASVADTAYRPVGLYVDLECTVPAINAGDQIAVWRDEFGNSNIVATQSNINNRPLLDYIKFPSMPHYIPMVYFSDGGGFGAFMTGFSLKRHDTLVFQAVNNEDPPSANHGAVFAPKWNSASGNTHQPWVDGTFYEAFGNANRINAIPYSVGSLNTGTYVYRVTATGVISVWLNKSLLINSPSVNEFPPNFSIGSSSAPFEGFYNYRGLVSFIGLTSSGKASDVENALMQFNVSV